jgi:FAD/FMN-containing dehydrogenase
MALGRRQFLQGIAAAAIAGPALFGAEQPDWPALRRRLHGQLVLPGESDYADAKLGYFTMYDRKQPAAIARCASTSDVQACVETAACHRFPIAARSGGHSYGGYSTPDAGLVVDLRQLKSIEVRPDGTAVVGAGANMMEVYTALARAGRLLPGGSCPSVGIAGLTLGGGFSVIGRKYGLACDNLVAAQIVTPDSVVRTVSERSHPDLFWALRGGGGGNFGIVTSFTFRTEPIRDFATFQLLFPVAAIAALVDAWQDWCREAPEELWAVLTLPYLSLSGTYAGTVEAVNPLIDAFISQTAQPSRRTVQNRTYSELVAWSAGCDPSNGSCTPSWGGSGGTLPRASFVSTSRIITKPITDPAAFAQVATGSPGVRAQMDTMGGAISRGRTAFPYAGAIGSIQILKDFTNGDEAAARAALRPVRDGLGPIVGETGYVNYIDPEMPDWAHAYYGDHLPLLKSVAARYDPTSVFGGPQSLTVA